MIQKIKNWFKKEQGFSTAAVFILSIPLLVGSFGLGLDSVRLIYVQEYLQGRADIATAAAVNTAYTDPASKKLFLGTKAAGTSGSLNVASNLYSVNTDPKRRAAGTYNGFLNPKSGIYGTPSVKIVGAPIDTARLCDGGAATPKYGVELTATEQVPATFLTIVGIRSFDVTVTSTSWVRAKTC